MSEFANDIAKIDAEIRRLQEAKQRFLTAQGESRQFISANRITREDVVIPGKNSPYFSSIDVARAWIAGRQGDHAPWLVWNDRLLNAYEVRCGVYNFNSPGLLSDLPENSDE